MSFDDLVEGMPTDDVQARLGEPHFTETGDDLVAYQYANIWITGWSDAPMAVVSYDLGTGRSSSTMDNWQPPPKGRRAT